MPEKDEGLLLTDEEFVELFTEEQRRQGVPDKYNFPEAIVGNVHYHRMLVKAQLAKATPIIEKQQQEKDTAYYAEMMKEAIDRVRTETKKQERGKIIEWAKYSKPIFAYVNNLGQCVTLVIRIPIKEYEAIWGKP